MTQPTKKAAESKTWPRALAPASESGDPAVHQLLAEKATALANGNDDEVKAVAKRLADLGYE